MRSGTTANFIAHLDEVGEAEFTKWVIHRIAVLEELVEMGIVEARPALAALQRTYAWVKEIKNL